MARLPGGGLRPRPVGLRPLVRPPRPRRGRRPRAGDGPRRERRRLAPLERRRPVGARRRTARRSRGVPGHHRSRHQRPVRPGDPRRLDAAARADAMRVRVLALTLLLTLGPGPATAHDGSTGPPPAATLLALVLGVVVYTRGLRRLQARGRPLPDGRHVAALVGGAALALALLPPVDRAAGILLFVHMAQHVLLTVVAAPLLALARPLAVLLAAAPRGWRPRRIPGTRRPAVIAWATHGAALWAWHLPPLYDVALTLPLVHAVEHATLLGTAVWLWWSATERRPAGALWLFTTAVHTSALGALLTLAPRPWLAGHPGGAGLTPLGDQQRAGLVVWVAAGAVRTGAALAGLAPRRRQAERGRSGEGRRPAMTGGV